jgi:glycosyltransferase involved in cell wall biosynthesis
MGRASASTPPRRDAGSVLAREGAHTPPRANDLELAVIRVAHLLPNMEIGGRERIVSDLCRTAPSLGIDPILVTYDPPTEGHSLLNAPGVPVVSLNRRDTAFRHRLRTLLDEQDIHVLHAQGHIPAALAAGAIGRVPMLATLHIALGTGWRWLVPIIRGLRAADRLTAVSEDLARRYGRLARRPIEVIPTGVDLERFAPIATRRDAGTPFTIGIAARLHPVKRLDDAVAALRILKGRGLSCRLLIAGEGPCRRHIAALAAGLDVELRGAVTDMPEFLRSLDAFLLPSDHEGTPAALLEAMAVGLPCIATRVGGIPALLGSAGLLVPRRAPHAIAEGIEHLLGNASWRAELGMAAAQRALAHAMTHQAQAYAALYSLMGDRDPHARAQSVRTAPLR